MVGEGKTVGVDKVSTKTEIEEAEHGSSVQNEAVKKLGKLNLLANKTRINKRQATAPSVQPVTDQKGCHQPKWSIFIYGYQYK